MRVPSLPAARMSGLATMLIWLLAALTALFLVWPVWRAFLPLEIWGNEGWNAYHADAAMRRSGLYPPPDALVANNYPIRCVSAGRPARFESSSSACC